MFFKCGNCSILVGIFFPSFMGLGKLWQDPANTFFSAVKTKISFADIDMPLLSIFTRFSDYTHFTRSFAKSSDQATDNKSFKKKIAKFEDRTTHFFKKSANGIKSSRSYSKLDKIILTFPLKTKQQNKKFFYSGPKKQDSMHLTILIILVLWALFGLNGALRNTPDSIAMIFHIDKHPFERILSIHSILLKMKLKYLKRSTLQIAFNQLKRSTTQIESESQIILKTKIEEILKWTDEQAYRNASIQLVEVLQQNPEALYILVSRIYLQAVCISNKPDVFSKLCCCIFISSGSLKFRDEISLLLQNNIKKMLREDCSWTELRKDNYLGCIKFLGYMIEAKLVESFVFQKTILAILKAEKVTPELIKLSSDKINLFEIQVVKELIFCCPTLFNSPKEISVLQPILQYISGIEGVVEEWYKADIFF